MEPTDSAATVRLHWSLRALRDLSLATLSMAFMVSAVLCGRAAWRASTGVAPSFLLAALEVALCVLLLRWQGAISQKASKGFSRIPQIATIADLCIALFLAFAVLVFVVLVGGTLLQSLGPR